MIYAVRADASDDKETRRRMTIAGLESGAEYAIVRPEDEDLSSVGRIGLIFNDSGSLSGALSGMIVNVDSPEKQREVMNIRGVDVVILSSSNWRMIVLENLIASLSKNDIMLFARTTDPEDVRLFSETLERGTDGIVIDTPDPESVKEFILAQDDDISLGTVTVESVFDAGIGDRVCVDTVSIMSPGEGMLIGSQASTMVLIQSESEDSGYASPRPFRVNAGAVHAYIMMADGSTKYLSELKAGDRVSIVNRNGSKRSTTVGRCKIERRPLSVIKFNDGGSIIVQNAETVKLVCTDGSVSVPEIVPGIDIVSFSGKTGRHFGIAIDETIREV